MLLIATVVITVCSYLFGFSVTPNTLLLSRIIIGLGNAFIMIGILKLISAWLPKKFFSIFIGIFIALNFFVSTVGIAPLTYISQSVGINTVSYIFTAVGIVVFFLFFIFIKNSDRESSLSAKFKLIEIRKLLSNTNIWIACLIAFITASYTLFFSLFGAPFLTQSAGYTIMEAASATLWFICGICFGAPIASFLSQLFYDRKYILSLGLIFSAIFIALIVFYTPSHFALTKLLYLFGFFAGCNVVLYLITNDVSSSATSGTAFSLLLIFGMIGGMLVQPLIGKIYGLFTNWSTALSIIPLTLLIGGLMSLFLKSTQWKADRIENKLYPIQYIKLGLNGKLSLGRSFWVIYIWGSLICAFLIISSIFTISALIPSLPSPNIIITNRTLITFLVYTLSFPYIVISVVSVWRCADNWQQWIGWKYVARILVVVGLISAVINILSSLSTLLA